MNIAIVSGKGGTGKSSLTSSLAFALSEKKKIVLVDADSDCPNQHIFFPGKKTKETPISVSKTALVDAKKCSGCGKCVDACQFGAVALAHGVAEIDGFRCEGCGACAVVCPEKAISLRPERSGNLIVVRTNFRRNLAALELANSNTKTKNFPLVYARLLPGRSGTGKMVYNARKLAEKIAEKTAAGLVLVDAPPGIGCPVIASIAGCDYVIGVVEPTPTSMTNLERALKVVEHFGIPYFVVMNKTGLSEKHENVIRRKFGKRLLASIPYDEEVPKLLARGIPPINGQGPAAKAFALFVKRLEELVGVGKNEN